MSLFDRVNGQKQITMQDLMNDPVGIGKGKGYNIPQNLSGNPQAMVQHLLQSGQVTPQQLQQMMQRARGMGFRF